MVYDIANNLDKSRRSYEDDTQFCQSKSGNLVSVDSMSKLSTLKRIIDEHKEYNGLKQTNYLIGNFYFISVVTFKNMCRDELLLVLICLRTIIGLKRNATSGIWRHANEKKLGTFNIWKDKYVTIIVTKDKF